MRIAIFALGSRGDVQPYIALGKGLQGAGHQVRLVTHENFAALVTSAGMTFHPMRGNVQEVAESPEMRALLESGNFAAIMRKQAQESARVAVLWAEDGYEACQDIDLIVVGLGGLFIGLALAEKLNLPIVQAHLIPLTPTSAFASVLLPPLPLGGALNRMSHTLTRQMIWQSSRPADKAAREQVLHLPASPLLGKFDSKRLRRYPILYGISSAVIPKPADWGENIHLTGYWFLDAESDWTPPADLVEFLDRGSPPVYIGFGSMANREPEATADLVLHALEQTGQRAILSSGWSGMHKGDLPDSVYMLDSIPHTWLFPHTAAVVHHGGAGTTAAGFRAGVPSIIIPFFADQPFWGRRAQALGVGTAPIPRKQLTAEKLAHAIQQAISDQPMRERAAQLGAKVRADDGAENAAKLISAIKL